uniref:Protein arginine methyltransferase NDUFAF7 n=1 Tax=Elaeis guineensis var. tenera TaxID=51953 RepID=A0A6J0PJL1_ELAGV|nr:protein arginine methyltransferase NDUFAF7, mitochondrial isoform X5 [Elaeis guineensis]
MLRRSLSRASPLLSNGLLQTLPLPFAPSTRSLRSLSSHTTPQTLNPSPSQEEESHENLRDSSRPTVSVSIDRSGLHNSPEHSHNPSSDSELVKHLKSIIKILLVIARALERRGHRHGEAVFRQSRKKDREEKEQKKERRCKSRDVEFEFRGGPISVAEYMEEVLTNPHSGFYINQDVFGAGGDFITSPEVSQMFGEVISLMIGVWTMCLWEQMGQPEEVNLIELGPGRGTLMADLLRGSSKFVNFKKTLHIHMVECSPTLQKLQYSALKCVDEAVNEDGSTKRTISMLSGSPVSWHSTLEQVPLGTPTIIIAHEFYDALPIHQFQKSSRGWCEKMVDVSEDSLNFRFVLSPMPTPATLLYLRKRCQWASAEEVAKLDHIEVCPKAMELTHQIAKRISSDGGGALIIDYGKNGIISDSLQNIYRFMAQLLNRSS